MPKMYRRSTTDDLLWLSVFLICILDLVDAKNVSAKLKNYTINQNLLIDDR
jgi:hypothetical protein